LNYFDYNCISTGKQDKNTGQETAVQSNVTPNTRASIAV